VKSGNQAKIQDTLTCINCHNNHSAQKSNVTEIKKNCSNLDCHSTQEPTFFKAVTGHGRRNISISDNFGAWLVSLLGKIILGICLFFTLIDNIVSSLRFKKRIEEIDDNANNSNLESEDCLNAKE